MFFLATRNEESSEESQEDEKQDTWEEQQMRKAVKITKVNFFFLCHVLVSCGSYNITTNVTALSLSFPPTLPPSHPPSLSPSFSCPQVRIKEKEK